MLPIVIRTVGRLPSVTVGIDDLPFDEREDPWDPALTGERPCVRNSSRVTDASESGQSEPLRRPTIRTKYWQSRMTDRAASNVRRPGGAGKSGASLVRTSYPYCSSHHFTLDRMSPRSRTVELTNTRGAPGGNSEPTTAPP